MPRRYLRRITHRLDFEKYLINGRDLDENWRAESVFPVQQPLEVEIGSGKGLFMAHESVKTPNHNFLGIEVAHNYAAYCALQLAKTNNEKGVSNAMMISGDATPIFTTNLQNDSVEAVHIYFPDPWWKKSHRKRRIVRPDVVRMIEERLIPGGILHFWTDVQEYFESGVEIIKLSTNLRGPFSVICDQTLDGHSDLDFHSHFERRARLGETPVWRSYFVKPQ